MICSMIRLGTDKATHRSAKKRKYDNDWKTQKRWKISQRRKAELLFISLDGTLCNGHFDPELGAAQITKFSSDLLNEVICENQCIESLDLLLSYGIFRDAAWEAVRDYLIEVA